jgi:phosphatidylglycerophosphate synthase
MRKIPPEHENPIDNVIIGNIVDNTHQYFRYYNFTPNSITLLSLLVGLISAYKLYKAEYALSALLFILAYYLDCMDGHYARTYKMTSKFGDVLDHCCDIIKMVVILGVMYTLDKKRTFSVLIVFLLLLIGMSVHLGCQQHYHKDNSEEIFLDLLKTSCKNKEWISKTRYFGCGTFIMTFALIILFWKYL